MPTNSNTITSADVPDGILAYRTGSNLLSKLDKKQFLAISKAPTTAKEETVQELKIADSFAQIAVCNYDIICAAIYRAPDSRIIRGFCCTKNHRPNETDAGMINNGQFPIIVNPTPPKLGNKTLETYLRDLQSKWLVQHIVVVTIPEI